MFRPVCSFFSPVLLLLIIGNIVSAQSPVRENCGNDRLTELMRRLSPDYDRRIQENNLMIRDHIRRKALTETVRLNGNSTGVRVKSFLV